MLGAPDVFMPTGTRRASEPSALPRMVLEEADSLVDGGQDHRNSKQHLGHNGRAVQRHCPDRPVPLMPHGTPRRLC